MDRGKAVTFGWVYVLSNPSYKGKVKVGYTDRTVPERIRELSASAAVPTPFVWEYGVYVVRAAMLERTVHRSLAHCRGSRSREFFDCEPVHAIVAIKKELPSHDVQEVFDRLERDKEADRLREQLALASQWHDNELARFAAMRSALNRELTPQSFNFGLFVVYALACMAAMVFLFDVKAGGSVIASIFGGAILATLHQSKREQAQKDRINFDRRSDEIRVLEQELFKHYDDVVARVRKGAAFEAVRRALPAAPLSPTVSAIAKVEPLASNFAETTTRSSGRSIGIGAGVHDTPATTGPGATSTSLASRPPRNFRCEWCSRTVNLTSDIDCGRWTCPALTAQSDPHAARAAPVERANPTTRAEARTMQMPPQQVVEKRYCLYCNSNERIRVEPAPVVCLRCRNGL